MLERAYSSYSYDRLEATARRNWSNHPILQQIAEELPFRKRLKAKRFLEEVRRRLDELDGKAIPRDDTESAQHARLQELLRAAVKRAEKAEAEVKRLTDALRQAQASRSRPQTALTRLYAKYGLASTCDDFVLDAVHRCYRKQYHPDTYSDRSPAEQQEATRRFQEVEVDFRTIRESRP